MENEETFTVEGFATMNKRFLWLIVLMAYIVFVLYLAVINRDGMEQNLIRTDLFQCYYQPSGDSYRDAFVNVVGFIPVGVLVGLLSKRYRVIKALLIGIMTSLIVECSQLIWHKGVFDVDDLMNNTLGAVIGGVIAIEIWRIYGKMIFLPSVIRN